jgi:L-2-hydroxyglutarate oxidase LhgO
MEKVNITIIGAGVIGLSVAAELARQQQDIFIVEKYPSFGQETSSRNSEVIHAGIYYPLDTLKLKTCLEGNRLLYEFCQSHNIPFKRLGKLIIAANKDEEEDLFKLFQRGRENGVKDLEQLTKVKLQALEPHIKAEAGLFSPSTGIFDTHSFMKQLVASFKKDGGQVAYSTELTKITKLNSGYELTVIDNEKESFTFDTKIIINCAGLQADKVAAMAGLELAEYRLKYCKGDYFRLAPAKASLINHLVYPVPKPKSGGLGIHLTPDLGGSVRLGPDDDYIKEIDYNINGAKAAVFCDSVKVFFPGVTTAEITPDTSGIRPKLQGPGEEFRDFVIRHEETRGYPGLINLIGIESPGLTGSLSIARIVAGLVKPLL